MNKRFHVFFSYRQKLEKKLLFLTNRGYEDVTKPLKLRYNVKRKPHNVTLFDNNSFLYFYIRDKEIFSISGTKRAQ